MVVKIQGTFTVMVTAFDDNGRVDLDAQARFTDWQVRNGIHGLIPLGSTGEFLSMSFAERKAVAECVINAAKGILLWSQVELTRVFHCELANQ